jgi:hypothetical protein
MRGSGGTAIVKKISLKDADNEEFKHYAGLTPRKRIQILLEILKTQGIHGEAMERTISVKPLNE